MKNRILYLDKPASEWELATPVGCGSLGAVIYGRIGNEILQLNEEFVWAGNPMNTDFPEFIDIIKNIRSLLLEGKATEADKYALEALGDKFHRIGSYETAGEIHINFHDDDLCTDYRREIDLLNGIATISYKKDDKNYNREIFASYPKRVIAMRLSCSEASSVNFSAVYKRGFIKSVSQLSQNSFEIISSTKCGNHYVNVSVVVQNIGGELHVEDYKVKLKNADSCDIFISIATDKVPLFPSELNYNLLKCEHIKDFSEIIDRSDIILGEDNEYLENISADKRLNLIGEGKNDGGFTSLYFNFGKYLLVSSSRPGTLPANLQGVWNDYMEAPWSSDYHTNINIQMNYWHAEVANISECTIPLFDYMNNYLLEGARRVANVNYHSGGAVVHHLSDIYGFAAPADGLWGLWPLGGAWLCFHMWEHYLYTGDVSFLANTAYSFISDCALFFMDTMFCDENGIILSGPSTSPENRYLTEKGSAYLCLSPTMDVEIIGGLLRFYIETEKILNINPEMAERAADTLSKMPPLKTGKWGQLMEWYYDYDEIEPGHRHISHLFALYPDFAININTRELFEAARKTLERRLANGGGHTGWSAAWVTALFARLHDGEAAGKILRKLYIESTRGNLFNIHPPFQIDGNFGGTAAICEMLLQSHTEIIELLPALPKEFNSGSFVRLKARGGYEISAEWENSIVNSFNIKLCASIGDNEIKIPKIKANGKIYSVELNKNKTEEKIII